MSTPYEPYRPPSAPLDGPRPTEAGATAVPDGVVAILAQTRPWVKLLASLFIVGSIIVLAATAFTAGAARDNSPPMLATLAPTAVFMLLYVPAVVFQWRFAAAIARLEKGGGLGALEDALRSQKSFWKYAAVLAVLLVPVSMVVGFVAGRLLRASGGP